MITIRRAGKEDAALLGTLSSQSFCETFTHYEPAPLQEFLSRYHSHAYYEQALADPHIAIWIAEENGKPVGYAKLGKCELPPCSDHMYELQRLYVLADQKGKGLGKALMQELEREAARRGAKELYLGVWEHNDAAKEFYRRQGFRKVGEYDYPPIGNVQDHEWILKKTLELETLKQR